MTKKDFELIASVMNEAKEDDLTIKQTALCFSVVLASKNPRFDKDRFLKACGVKIDCKIDGCKQGARTYLDGNNSMFCEKHGWN